MKIKFDELCIQEAESFYKTINDELSIIENNPLILDFSNIEKIDLSAIQIIIALKRYCKLSDIPLSLINLESSQVKESIKTFNLYTELGLKP